MVSTLLNMGLGALIKLISGGLTQWFQFRRQKELSILNADTNKIVALQGGEDKADPWTKFTRRIIALTLTATWTFVIAWVVLHPEVEYQVFMGRNVSWLWEFLWPFPINEKGVATISAGALLWDFKTMFEVLVGFYFTKVGK